MRDKLVKKRGVLSAEVTALLQDDELTDEGAERVKAAQAEIRKLDDRIDLLDAQEKLEMRGSESAGRQIEQPDGKESPTGPVVEDKPEERSGAGRASVTNDNEADRPFTAIGDQLRAIYRAAANPGVPPDKRLLRLNERDVQARAYTGASGMNEGIDNEGGFAVQTDFAGRMLDLGIKTGVISSRVDTYTIGPNANGAEWTEVDQSSVATTVAGGVQVYWVAEAQEITGSQPKLKQRKLELVKLAGLAYATGEMLQDSTFAGDFLSRSFATAIGRETDSVIVSGNGVGKPTGLSIAPALTTVAKETAQTADTIVFENLSKMRNAMHPDYLVNNQVTEQGGQISSLVWLMHPDCGQQLDFLEFPVGTGGVPVYLPPGGLSGSQYTTLFGIPILLTDHCEALGDLGDIYLTDLQQYMLIRKGGIQSETSMHVRFLFDEMAFRFIIRLNGAPKQSSALTIKNSSTTRSAVVTLAERA